jgi:hypothetical protein
LKNLIKKRRRGDRKMIKENKNSEETIRKKVVLEMIIDKLFNSLKKTTKGIKVDNYYIDDEDLTYLLEKYDSEKFNEYKEMLFKQKEE